MNSGKKYVFLAVILVWIFFLSESCSRKKTPENQIGEKTKDLAVFAEKENLEGLSGMLADQYRDADGRDRIETLEMVGDLFERAGGIVIHLLNTSIRFNSPDNAMVESEALISQGAAMALRRLAKMAGRYYLFRVQWKRDQGEWKIIWAKWEEIFDRDLTVKALERLEKILPNE